MSMSMAVANRTRTLAWQARQPRMWAGKVFPTPGLPMRITGSLLEEVQVEQAEDAVSSLLARFVVGEVELVERGLSGETGEFEAAALPLALGLAANELLRMVRGRLKDLLIVTATAIVRQAAPDQNGIPSFCPEAPLKLNTTPKKFTAYRNSCRVVPPPRRWGGCSSNRQNCCSFKPGGPPSGLTC